MRDVIVVGGGVAGLVAARECAHIGLRVTVYEATDAVGGAVASHEVAGLTLDAGADSFATRRGSVPAFLEGLGLADQIVAPNAAGAWLCLPADGPGNGVVSVPLPKTGLLGIPGSPLADDVRRVIGWKGAWRAYLDRIIPVLKIGREHNLGELVEKRMGRRVLERLVEPVASGVYSAPAKELEVDVVAPGLNAALTTTGSLSGAVLSLRSQAPAGSAVGGLRGGMAGLVTALVADLKRYDVEIVTGTSVSGLSVSGTEEKARWTATLTPTDGTTGGATGGTDASTARSGTAESSTVESRFVIVAAPGAQALDLLRPLGDTFQALGDLEWPQPTAVELATLVVDAPELDSHPRGTGALVAAGTPGIRAKALTHGSAKWAWVDEAAGPGRHVLRLSYGLAGAADTTTALGDDAFRELALRDASAILGVDLGPGAVRGFARSVWRDALAPATVGARERVQAVREAVAQTPGLEVTGGWLAGTGLASVIPDAKDAASRTRHAAIGL
jgi:oxygen-dependent protoporphyrinogen oxidase